MTIFGLFLVDTVKDLLTSVVFYRAKQQRDAERTVRLWQPQRVRIPIANWYFKRRTGGVSRIGKFRNRKLTQAVRWFVNSETFEHVLAMFFNQRAAQAKKSAAARIQPQGVRWSSIRLVS